MRRETVFATPSSIATIKGNEYIFKGDKSARLVIASLLKRMGALKKKSFLSWLSSQGVPSEEFEQNDPSPHSAYISERAFLTLFHFSVGRMSGTRK